MKTSVRKIEQMVLTMMRSYAPRWIILIIDLGIVSIAYLSLLIFRSSVTAEPVPLLEYKFLLIMAFYAFASVMFKTYHGVVRFSTMVDFKRLASASALATILYEIICVTSNLINHQKGIPPIFNLWFPVVLGMVTISGQLIFRFIVKSIFERLEVSPKHKGQRVFILGHEYESVLLANSILAENSNPYEPVAYISLEPNSAGKLLGSLPILNSAKGLQKLMAIHNAKTLLLYKSQLDSMPKEFYDRCIVEGLELLMVNMFTKHSDNNGQTLPQINKIKIEDLLGRNAIKMNREAIENQFEGQTILITGAAGSIGSEMARQVKRFNCKTIVLVDQAETPLNDLWLELIADKPTIEIFPIIASVTNSTKMRKVFERFKPSLVFHAAAYKHVPIMEHHPSTAVYTNVGGTKIIADLAVEFGVNRFVMISTDKAVNPTNVMGASKRAAEIYIQSLYYRLIEEQATNPTQFVTTRFGNVLGSNGSVVPLFKRQIEAGGPITITHKEITRYFMTIPEACSLVMEAGCTGNGGEIYIFDMGDAVKIYDLAEKMIRLSGKVPDRDIKIIETGLRPGEKLFEELLSNKENTIPTYHKKVMIAKVRKYCFCELSPIVDDMIEAASQFTDPTEVVRKLKRLIPEFRSQNSMYEALDKELDLERTKKI